MKNGYKIIDADAHFYEPSDIWDRIEPEFYDRRPKVAKVHGKAIFEYEGEELTQTLRTKSLFEDMEKKFGQAYRDGWTLESRLRDMDREGWDIQVCLSTNGGRAGRHKDEAVQPALCRAYNNWAHEFCSGAPQRVKFTGVVPSSNIEEMVIETRRAVEKLGAVSLLTPPAMPNKMWNHPDYDLMWETVQELDFPLSLHGGATGSGQPNSMARYINLDGAFPALNQAIEFPFENMISLGHFIFTGILDRFPNLRLLILEANAGWVPFWINRLEKCAEGRQSVFFDEHPLKLSPWEYFRRQCAVAADADEIMLSCVVEHLGVDNLVFNTDYPHPDAPAPSEPLRNMIAQPLSDENKRKILWDNSVNIYGKRLIQGHPLANG
jgi:predicted TIM-barrel fold metal-dependent hydrolase